MGALGSAAGGLVLGVWGFPVLNLLGAVLVAGPLAAVWLLRPALAGRSGLERPEIEVSAR
jgi:hypothetical protein